MAAQRVVIAVVVLAGMAIAAWLVLAGQPTRPERGTVRVVEGPATPAAQPPMATPSGAPMITPRPDVLRALRLPATTPITSITRDDPREGVVCGSVAAAEGRTTRFVYLRSAAMAALDDGDAAFEPLSRRLCGS